MKVKLNFQHRHAVSDLCFSVTIKLRLLTAKMPLKHKSLQNQWNNKQNQQIGRHLKSINLSHYQLFNDVWWDFLVLTVSVLKEALSCSEVDKMENHNFTLTSTRRPCVCISASMPIAGVKRSVSKTRFMTRVKSRRIVTKFNSFLKRVTNNDIIY